MTGDQNPVESLHAQPNAMIEVFNGLFNSLISTNFIIGKLYLYIILSFCPYSALCVH